MINLLEIATGWYKFIQGSKATRSLMQSRLNKCSKCIYRQQLDKTGRVLVQAIHKEGSVYKCGLCHCPLAGLTANPMSSCKAGKW